MGRAKGNNKVGTGGAARGVAKGNNKVGTGGAARGLQKVMDGIMIILWIRSLDSSYRYKRSTQP